jgi:hypothetical protein
MPGIAQITRAPVQYTDAHLVGVLPQHTPPTPAPAHDSLSEAGQLPGHPDQPIPVQAHHSHRAAGAHIPGHLLVAERALGADRSGWLPCTLSTTVSPGVAGGRNTDQWAPKHQRT